ncbi:MAG: T9SS type A sorting domain-containing protein [Flavobacteriales bacterium]|nr:T9SS type A sorting domain-containing protein [Flavobacteriales bacterium]
MTIAAAEQLSRISVCNASGRVVLEQGFNTQQLALDISAWPAGLYAVRAAGADGRMHTLRFVRE